MFLTWTINIWPWLSTKGTANCPTDLLVLCHKTGQFSKNWEMLHQNPDSSFIWEQQQKQKAEDLATVGAPSAETEQWMCLFICHSRHHSLMSHMPHISLSDIEGLAPEGIWVRSSCCKSQCKVSVQFLVFSLFTALVSFFMLNSLWPLPTVGALEPHPLLRQESFSPWAATCLPPWVFPFSAFPFPSLLLAIACTVQSQNLSASERTVTLPPNGMGEGVLRSVLLEQGPEMPHKTWTGPFRDSSWVFLGLSTHRRTERKDPRAWGGTVLTSLPTVQKGYSQTWVHELIHRNTQQRSLLEKFFPVNHYV